MKLSNLIEYAKMGASHERYMQSTVHDWNDDITPVARLTAWMFRFTITHVLVIMWYEALRVLVCNRRGHDMEDTGSWANPDSGGEDMTCRRCGFHFHHVYY